MVTLIAFKVTCIRTLPVWLAIALSEIGRMTFFKRSQIFTYQHTRFLCLLFCPLVLQIVCKMQSLDPDPSQLNPVHILEHNFFKINFTAL